MDPQQQQLNQLQELFTNAQEILIITKENPSIDGLAASLGLYATLQGQRTLQGKEKKVIISVSGKQGSQYTLLPFSDKIVSELGLRDLVIGISGYAENSIENVNWYVDKDRLNVVFKANPAVPMQFDLKNLDPFYAGANFDVVIVVDTAAPADLGNAYKQDPGMYSELPVVNISTQAQNTRFGKVNIVDPSIRSVSELVFQLTQILRYSITPDAATLFLTGIGDATQNFQNKGPQTDEIVQMLQSLNAHMLDLSVLYQQASTPIAPSAPALAQPQYAQPQAAYSNYPGQYPYAPMPYQPMPPGYPSFSQPGYPPQQPYYPYPPQYPGYSYQQPPQPNYPPSIAPNPVEYPSESVYENTIDASQEGFVTEVPSIEHDASQQTAYIPTSGVTGYSHVEPSVYIPQTPYEVIPNTNSEPAMETFDTSIQTQDQKNVPDFSQAPKFFEGSRER